MSRLPRYIKTTSGGWSLKRMHVSLFVFMVICWQLSELTDVFLQVYYICCEDHQRKPDLWAGWSCWMPRCWPGIVLNIIHNLPSHQASRTVHKHGWRTNAGLFDDRERSVSCLSPARLLGPGTVEGGVPWHGVVADAWVRARICNADMTLKRNKPAKCECTLTGRKMRGRQCRLDTLENSQGNAGNVVWLCIQAGQKTSSLPKYGRKVYKPSGELNSRQLQPSGQPKQRCPKRLKMLAPICWK